jgi:hypothetical protein
MYRRFPYQEKDTRRLDSCAVRARSAVDATVPRCSACFIGRQAATLESSVVIVLDTNGFLLRCAPIIPVPAVVREDSPAASFTDVARAHVVAAFAPAFAFALIFWFLTFFCTLTFFSTFAFARTLSCLAFAFAFAFA